MLNLIGSEGSVCLCALHVPSCWVRRCRAHNDAALVPFWHRRQGGAATSQFALDKGAYNTSDCPATSKQREAGVARPDRAHARSGAHPAARRAPTPARRRCRAWAPAARPARRPPPAPSWSSARRPRCRAPAGAATRPCPPRIAARRHACFPVRFHQDFGSWCTVCSMHISPRSSTCSWLLMAFWIWCSPGQL